jgi:alanine dehydrogenase
MIIGVPKEIKTDEYRVAMLPVGVAELVADGHQVLIQSGAGAGSGLSDEEYEAEGAQLVSKAKTIFEQADLIVKVKEPQRTEWLMIRPGQIIFTYYHFAADRELTEGMLKSGATCVAYETLTGPNGSLPLLTPMSEVAGRMSIQEGARFLERPQMGRGILLGGVPGVPPAHITIIGGGVVGTNAAKIAAGFKADVAILDINVDRLRHLDDIMPANVNVLFSDRHTIREQLKLADLVIGAVLIPGAKAPRVITREDLRLMKPGSVIVDVAVDQGGCVETTRPTSHSDPVYVEEGVVHYCVANMPGAVGRTSTFALCNVTLPWIRRLAGGDLMCVARANQPIRDAINIHDGLITYKPVADTFNLKFDPIFAA